MGAFDTAFARTVGIEGDFSDDPADSGGATRFGITEAVARAYSYQGEMRALPFELAREIYRRQYWNLLRLDDVAEHSAAVAEELFDTGVNCGVEVAARFLQRALNAFNRVQRDYPDLKVDGILGAVSVNTLRVYLTLRGGPGEIVLLRALNSLQGARYIGLAEAREKDERFVYGWFLQRVA